MPEAVTSSDGSEARDRDRPRVQARHEILEVDGRRRSSTRMATRSPVVMGCYGIGDEPPRSPPPSNPRTTRTGSSGRLADRTLLRWWSCRLQDARTRPSLRRPKASTKAVRGGGRSTCLLDDRDLRPGVKFKDADLIGDSPPGRGRRARAEGGDGRGEVADGRGRAPRTRSPRPARRSWPRARHEAQARTRRRCASSAGGPRRGAGPDESARAGAEVLPYAPAARGVDSVCDVRDGPVIVAWCDHDDDPGRHERLAPRPAGRVVDVRPESCGRLPSRLLMAAWCVGRRPSWSNARKA